MRERWLIYDDSKYSLQEYLDKAKEILIARPELGRLGRLIDKIKCETFPFDLIKIGYVNEITGII